MVKKNTIPPGYLNPTGLDSADTNSVDINETWSSLISRGTSAALKQPNSLQTGAPVQGILLRIIEPETEEGKTVANASLELFTGTAQPLRKYVVRIPDNDAFLPEPDVGDGIKAIDNFLIDMHAHGGVRVFEAENVGQSEQAVKPGDAVWVRFDDTTGLTHGTYLGPLKGGPAGGGGAGTTGGGGGPSARRQFKCRSQYGGSGPTPPAPGAKPSTSTTTGNPAVAAALSTLEAAKAAFAAAGQNSNAPGGWEALEKATAAQAEAQAAYDAIKLANPEAPPPAPTPATTTTTSTGTVTTAPGANPGEPWVECESVPGVWIRRIGTQFCIPEMREYLHGLATVPGGEDTLWAQARTDGGTSAWYAGDLSNLNGGPCREHASHQCGNDVDLSVPLLASKSGGAEKKWVSIFFGPKMESAIANNTVNTSRHFQSFYSYRTGRGARSSGYIVTPDILDVDACIAFLKYSIGWAKIAYLWTDLIAAIKARAESSPGQADPAIMTQDEYGIIFKNGSNPAYPRKMLRKLKRHSNHFHVRLRASGIREAERGRRSASTPIRRGGQLPGLGNIQRSGDITGPRYRACAPQRGGGKTPPSESPHLESGCTAEQYKEHMEKQIERMKGAMDSTPDLAAKESLHDGKQNIIVAGQQIDKDVEFKVIRFDDTMQDLWFLKSPAGSPKGWYDPTDSATAGSKNNPNVFKVVSGEDNWYRSPESITHVTISNVTSNANMKASNYSDPFFHKLDDSGKIFHFAIDEDGQIIQICDVVTKFSQNSGATLDTSTDNFAVHICLLTGLSKEKHKPAGSFKETIPLPDIGSAKRFNLRSYNKKDNLAGPRWDTPCAIGIGTRAAHESCHKLILWLGSQTAIKHKYAFMDARIAKNNLLASTVQARYQLQDDRYGGMSYIFWAGAKEIDGKVETNF